MSQFYNFNLNMNAVNKGCKNPVPARNLGVQAMPKSDSTSNTDTFQKQGEKSKQKNILILGSIIGITAILAFGIKSGKFKKLFEKFSSNPPQNSGKVHPSRGNPPQISGKTPLNTGNLPVNTDKPLINADKTPAVRETPSPKAADKKAETPAASKPERVHFLIRTKKQKFKITKRPNSAARQATTGNTGEMIIKRRSPKTVQRLGNVAIQTILNKEKLTEQDLRQIQTIFKNNTGISLYCPESCNFEDFKPFFDLIFNGKFYKKMDPKIKHIVMGHGIGGAKEGTWRFIRTKENVFDFIEKNIPKGDTVLVMTCEETARRIKPGVGTPVNITLLNPDKPGKIVIAGERRIAGKITQYEPKIQYF